MSWPLPSSSSYVRIASPSEQVEPFSAHRKGNDYPAWALGTKAAGENLLLSPAMAGAEHTTAWEALLDDLTARQLRRPQLVITDGSKGLATALHRLWPGVTHQRCTVHIAGRDPRLPEGWNVPSRASPYELGSLGSGVME
jgi:hypothetical protein